jgi:hypothetical protein
MPKKSPLRFSSEALPNDEQKNTSAAIAFAKVK